MIETICYGLPKKQHKIYMRLYKEQRILELHCDKGIPIDLFMTIKNHLKSRYQDIEIRVI